MDYAWFRSLGYQVGSGAMESLHREKRPTEGRVSGDPPVQAGAKTKMPSSLAAAAMRAS